MQGSGLAVMPSLREDYMVPFFFTNLHIWIRYKNDFRIEFGTHFPFWCRSRSGSFSKFYTCWKIPNFLYFFFTAVPEFTLFCLSRRCHRCRNFHYTFWIVPILKLFRKKWSFSLHSVEMDSGTQIRIHKTVRKYYCFLFRAPARHFHNGPGNPSEK